MVDDERRIELKLKSEMLKTVNEDLQAEYRGPYHETVAKLFKGIMGVNIIIPGLFRSSQGKCAIKCTVGSHPGDLFPLNTAVLFTYRPILYIKNSEIARVEFRRVTVGSSVRNFDFEIIMKSGESHMFSSARKDELEVLTNHFVQAKIMVKVINDQENSDNEVDDDGIKAKDEELESEDDDFAEPDLAGYATDDDDEYADKQIG